MKALHDTFTLFLSSLNYGEEVRGIRGTKITKNPKEKTVCVHVKC